MKSISNNMTFADIPTRYADLLDMFPLRPIHDKVDLQNATEIADAMAGHKLGKDQEDYFSVLAILINEFEAAHLPQPRRSHDPLANLKFLMEQHKMSASDLGRLLGQRELGSKILLRQRELSKAHIRKLADHFHVSPVIFF